MKQLDVDVYRSTVKEGMYAFVSQGDNLQAVLPQELLVRFGRGEFSMKLVLSPEKKLARTDAKKVMESIAAQGFYLQLPPGPETYMQEIQNDKMTNKPL